MQSLFDINNILLAKIYEPVIDGGYLPDAVTRMGIRAMLRDQVKTLQEDDQKKQAYFDSLRGNAIAINTKEANEQHYELPTEFFKLCLGHRMKYSCCYFEPNDDLDKAEDRMLEMYCERAQLQDGMDILELGCGWGSMTLFMAQKYPNARITGISNSSSQREYILSRAKELGLNNVNIITCDINKFEHQKESVDRIVSIEMFEHMKNYQVLLKKVSDWLKPDGKLFIHVFCHKSMPYDFDASNEESWMSKYFFTGGTMPSADLFLWFQQDLKVEQRWQVNGVHYGKTNQEWLNRLDANRKEALEILKVAYGDQAWAWYNRWRVFYLAMVENFNYDNGNEWFVVHYLFNKI